MSSQKQGPRQNNTPDRKEDEPPAIATAKAFLQLPLDISLVMDGDGTLLDFNENLPKRLGRAREEIIGKCVYDLLPPPVGTLRRAKVAEILNTGRALRFEDRNGQFWYDNIMYPVPAEKRDLTKIAVLAYDITARKRAEEALQESEARYRSIFENAVEGIFQVSPEGRYLRINPAFARIHGFESPEEMMASVTDARIFVSPTARQEYLEVLKKEGAVVNFELERYRKDNTRIWVSMSARVVRNESGEVRYYEGMAYDITARKHAEQALRVSEWRCRTLLENINDGVCITGPDRTFTFVNDIVVERSGHPREWFQGRTALDLVKPELGGIVRELGNRSMRGEKVPPFEVSYANAAGDELWMECHIASLYEEDKFAGFLTVNRDITERKRMEEELRKHRYHLEQLVAERTQALKESEKRYRELVDNALVGVYQTTVDGKVLYHNEHLIRMLGFESLEEIKASKFPLRYKNAADRKPHLKILRENGKLAMYETEFLTRDGETLNVLISARLNGDIISGMVLDITDRKKAEEELRVRSEQLNELNIALKVLLAQRDKDRKDMEERFVANVKHLVLPYLEDLSRMSLRQHQETLVSIAKANLGRIVSPFLHNIHHEYSSFTPGELRVAGFIRDGKTVKEIASILGISEAAVNSHRQHIRNKLGLKDKKINLRAHLLSLGDTPQSIS